MEGVLIMGGIIMKDSNIKIPPVVLFIIMLIISALLGMAEYQLLVGKPEQYRENMLWKYTILFYALTMAFAFWVYFSKKYLPILLNMLIFVGVNLILSIPYFFILTYTGTVTINAILIILPSQIVFISGVFIWHVATEFDPDLEKSTRKIMFKGFIIGIIAFFIMGLSGLPDLMALFLASLAPFAYFLLLLIRAKKKLDSDLE